MSIDPTLLIYGVLLLSVVLLIEGGYYVFLDLRARKMHRTVGRRLTKVGRGTGDGVPPHLRRRGPRTTIALPPLRAIERLIARSGQRLSVTQFLLLLAVLTLTIDVTASTLLRVAPLVAALIAVITGVGLPFAALALMVRRRTAKFLQQLPDALDMIVRSLRAGHPVDASIKLVAREMPEPTGSQFGMVFDEVTYGLDLREALANLGERMPCRELHFMIVAVRIQYGAGGNLAEILEALSGMVRERERMRRRILALSAEGRLSGWVLSALPFLVFGTIKLMNPGYYAGLFVDPTITWTMGCAFGALMIGLLVMRRLVNFQV